MRAENILQIAMEQSAEDIGCKAEDFMKNQNVLVPFRLGKNARKYLEEPILANFVSYGNNVVAAAAGDIQETVSEYVGKYAFYHLFETPNMHWLDDRLAGNGTRYASWQNTIFPTSAGSMRFPAVTSCGFLPADFKNLYLPEWGNALCEKRQQLDVLGVGAYADSKLVGLAGCSADCEKMWQIGVDVLPEYRRNGIACALTSRLACEILEREKVPFYCSAWSNIRSVRNAIKSGFVPAWVEMTVKPDTVITHFNENH